MQTHGTSRLDDAEVDAELLARARAGDTAAFGELVGRHQRAAVRVAAIVSGSTEEAVDIVQDAWIRIHRSLPHYRGDGSVRSWMLRAVANQARNHVRARVRRLQRDDRASRLVVHASGGVDDDVIRRVEHETTAVALAGLHADDRAVLGCRFVAGLSEVETAAVLAIPLGTVKSRTSRALERLRRGVERIAGEETT